MIGLNNRIYSMILTRTILSSSLSLSSSSSKRVVYAVRKNSNSFSSSSSPPQSPSLLSSSITHHRLRRALLYVPGNDMRKINKILNITGGGGGGDPNDDQSNVPDCIVFDCEDGVAINMKAQARETILNLLSSPTFVDDQQSSSPLLERIAVRVNSIQSGLVAQDLSIILSGKILPKTLLLPKVDSISDIDQFMEILHKTLANRSKQLQQSSYDDEPIDLIIYTESAIGLLDLRDIVRHILTIASNTSSPPPCRLVGVVFGSDDFCANIGATRTDDGKELLLARQHVVLVTKAYELQSIDTVYIDFRNKPGLLADAQNGAALGFTGKQCIHPAQVSSIQQAFSPTVEKIQWAKGLVEGFEEAQRDGRGAFVYRGQMIDMPLLRQAYNVLSVANKSKI